MAQARNLGGRPSERVQLSAQAELGQKIRAENVNAVCDFMATRGFRSPREFMRELFGNPKCNARQSGFYKQGGGFEDVVGLMLNDKRGGMAKELPEVLRRWVNQRAEKEYDSMINNKELNTKLRYSKARGQEFPSPSTLIEFRTIVERHSPLVWGLLSCLATKENHRKEEENHRNEEENHRNEEDHDDQDSTLIPLTAALSLLFARNQQCNMFQVMFSVLYYSHGLEKRAREILTGQGLMVGTTTTNTLLREMARGVRRNLQNRVRVKAQIISIDNVNQKIGVRHANLHAKSYIDNSTAGYAADMAGCELLPAGQIGIPAAWWNRGARRTLDPLDMLPSRATQGYLIRQTRALLTDVLSKRIPGFKTDRSLHFPHQTVRKLRPDESRQFSAFELMPFDQGTVDGNGDSLLHAATVECGYSKEQLEEILILVSGDQLTMDRARSLRTLKEGETYGNRFNWVLPLVGLFHLSMNFLKMFMKNHMGSPSDPASLAGCNAVLRRENINEKVSDFWSVLDLLDDCLDSYILNMVIEEAGLYSVDELEEFLAIDTQLENPSWPTLIERCAEMLKPNAVAKLRAKAQRDLSRENSILFVRHALGFRDFWTACKYGDIGRCLNMLDLW
jgi:hypothetical protein